MALSADETRDELRLVLLAGAFGSYLPARTAFPGAPALSRITVTFFDDFGQYQKAAINAPSAHSQFLAHLLSLMQADAEFYQMVEKAIVNARQATGHMFWYSFGIAELEGCAAADREPAAISRRPANADQFLASFQQ